MLASHALLAAGHALLGSLTVATALAACGSRPTTPSTEVPIVAPRLWDADALASWALPVAGLGVPPRYPSPAEYYALPVDNLRTYPVYHPSREPAGYLEKLRAAGPQPLIDPAALHTRADWIEAGRRVFEQLDTAASRTADPAVIAHFTDATAVDKFRDATHDVVDRDGVLLDYRWVVDRDGTLKLSFVSCAGCHTRLMPDGSLLAGAPSNYDLGGSPAAEAMLAQLVLAPGMSSGEQLYAESGVPWRADDLHARLRTMTDEEIDALGAQDDGAPPGEMFARFNGSPFYPTRMADLRGIADRRYLDVTGTHRNRGPEDVARYGIIVEFVDRGEFGPHRMVPGAAAAGRVRPPDEAMYAMALYLYSLGPAPSPHPMDELARHGERVFAAEGCPDCHPPPHYTNNELIAAGDIGTDPGMTTRTRKGTGFYRVPSLRGVWYRGLFEHSGSVASLADWFDPRRLQPDYRPTGWRGKGVEHRAVSGHEFGLDLSPDDKRALIAFLETL